MSDYTLRSSITAIRLAGSGITQIPPESQISLVSDGSRERKLQPGMTIILWQRQEYGVFKTDLMDRAMRLV